MTLIFVVYSSSQRFAIHEFFFVRDHFLLIAIRFEECFCPRVVEPISAIPSKLEAVVPGNA